MQDETFEGESSPSISVLPKRKLRKFTIRLEDGSPSRLAELTGLDYNKAIRALVRHAILQLEKQASSQTDAIRKALAPDLDEALKLLDND